MMLRIRLRYCSRRLILTLDHEDDIFLGAKLLHEPIRSLLTQSVRVVTFWPKTQQSRLVLLIL